MIHYYWIPSQAGNDTRGIFALISYVIGHSVDHCADFFFCLLDEAMQRGTRRKEKVRTPNCPHSPQVLSSRPYSQSLQSRAPHRHRRWDRAFEIAMKQAAQRTKRQTLLKILRPGNPMYLLRDAVMYVSYQAWAWLLFFFVVDYFTFYWAVAVFFFVIRFCICFGSIFFAGGFVHFGADRHHYFVQGLSSSF